MTAGGFTRYVFGKEIILDSSSWEKAQNNIKKEQKKYFTSNNKNYFYKNNSLWKEYQFLFLVQLVEFQLAEIIGFLYEKKKIEKKCIKDFINSKKGKGIDAERKSNPKRILSPYTLLVTLEKNLGSLINLLEIYSLSFDGKKELLDKLNKFRAKRNDFIHHSMSNSIKLSETLKDGMILGKETLNKFEKISTSL